MNSTSLGFPPHFLLGVEPRYCHVLSTWLPAQEALHVHAYVVLRAYSSASLRWCVGSFSLQPCHYPNTVHDFLIIFFALSSHELLGTRSSGPCLLCSALSQGNFPLSKPSFICSHTEYLVSATSPSAMTALPPRHIGAVGLEYFLEEQETWMKQ